jgi:D-alanyl-D-alanine carboxypeptidase/D-alanyl-D-alanine-endopeptidase (penicillin-binding protein 4)
MGDGSSRVSGMKLSLTLFIIVALLGPASALADMQSDIRTVLQDKLLHKATVGIQVVRLGTSATDVRPIYTLEADTPLIPASNLKLTTTSAALDALGPDFKFRTTLVRVGEDLVVIGDGDPTFGDAEFLKHAGWNVTTVFQGWAAQLQKLKITTVRDVIVDDSVFEEPAVHSHWPADQLDERYVAEVAGLNLNANCVDFTITPGAPGQLVAYVLNPATHYLNITNTCVTSSENAVRLSRDPDTNNALLTGHAPPRGTVGVSLTVHDPSLFAATVFSETLKAAGINVTGDVRRDRTVQARHDAGSLKWDVLGINETPLGTALARANKDSMNLYAESLCKRLGFALTHQPGSWANGTAAVAAFLRKAGVPSEQFNLDDGCGLSKLNTISPSALCKLLAYNFYSPNRQAFMSSLAVAGIDGTLDDRFRGSDIRGRLFGKSGFVEGVSSLSGYLHARDGEWYAFSILMNGIPHLSNSEIKPLQEKIIKAVDASTMAISLRQ